jgi:uncharacterized protein
VRAMLPHVDEFRPVHNLEALADLCEALSARTTPAHHPRAWRSNTAFQSAQA